jgi:hypothetical protein
MLYKPILQSVVLNICAHSKYPSLKELKEGVVSGFLNESRVKNKDGFWSQVRTEVILLHDLLLVKPLINYYMIIVIKNNSRSVKLHCAK